MDSWQKARLAAEEIIPKITLEERAHWCSKPGYKCYNVLLDGKSLGTVEHGDETIERGPKGARYVTRRWTRKRWRYSNIALASARLYYDSRKRAVAELVEHLIAQGKLKV